MGAAVDGSSFRTGAVFYAFLRRQFAQPPTCELNRIGGTRGVFTFIIPALTKAPSYIRVKLICYVDILNGVFVAAVATLV